MPQKSDKLAALRSAIGQQLTPRAQSPSSKEEPKAESAKKDSVHPPAKRKPPAEPKARQRPATAAVGMRSGRGVQFYLDDEDRKLISSLALWFASQDRRVSDSQVIKILIRATRPNSALLEVCDVVRQNDRRRETRPKKDVL